MIEIYGPHNARWLRFLSSLSKSENLNKEMNLRFFFLQRTADLSNHEGIQSAAANIAETIRRTNSGFARLQLCKTALYNQTAFIRPSNQTDDFDIVQTAADDMPPGFGAIPLIIGIGVAVVVLVTGALATVKICDTIQAKAIADLKLEQLKAEQIFAQSSPTVQNKWNQFRQIQAPLLKEIDRLQGQNQGLFGGIGESLKGIALFAVAAFVLFRVFESNK